MNREEIQNAIYLKLTESGINEIPARYIAMRLQDMTIKSVLNVTKIDDINFQVYTDVNKYSLTLHSQLGIPDAEIRIAN